MNVVHGHVQSIPAGLKWAVAASIIGAVILGIGLALLLARPFELYTFGILAFGLGLHLLGMLNKRRLESGLKARKMLWVETLHWICWAGLFLLAGYVVIDLL